MTTTVLPQIDSFTKSDHRREASDCEIYDDVQFSTSPISSDSDHVNQQQYTDDLSIKYESNQEHDSVITYGSDELVDNYENVSVSINKVKNRNICKGLIPPHADR